MRNCEENKDRRNGRQVMRIRRILASNALNDSQVDVFQLSC